MFQRIKEAIKNSIIVYITVIVMCITSFYIIVLSGVFPYMQELWVTTAMTTMSHKWLATAVIPRSTIDKIMQDNLVDDSGYKTDVGLVDVKAATKEGQRVVSGIGVIEEVEGKKTDYIAEGYEKLEDGLYKKDVSGTGWVGYIMLVEDPSKVHLVDTENQFVHGETVQSMVARSGAIAGVNGGGFNDGRNYDSNGGDPAGIIIKDGNVVAPKKDNGGWHPVIGLTKENILVLGQMTSEVALQMGIRDAVAFQPYLIVNGEPIIKSGNGGWGIAPRTAIGQRATGEILFLCIDGRQVHSIGVDLRVVQDTLYEEGAVNAALLDGGSSTVMVYKDEFINKPSLGKERRINNAWVVMP